MPRDRWRDLTLSCAVSDSDSGEHALPACKSRQLGETRIRDHHNNTRKNIAGKAAGNCRLAACVPQFTERRTSRLFLELRLEATELRLRFPQGDRPDMPRRHMPTPSGDTVVLRENDPLEGNASIWTAARKGPTWSLICLGEGLQAGR